MFAVSTQLTPVRALSTQARASPAARYSAGALAAGAVTGFMLYNMAGNPLRLDGKAVPHGGAPGTENERSFIMIKPDGVSRQLVGQIIARFEARGYKLVGLKLVTPSKELAEKHYADLSSRPFFPGLVKYITEGTPVVAMVWEGKDVIKQGRAMLGATNPQDSAPGTIRGAYCVSVGRNAIHGSDGPESAANEIALWFKPEEISGNWKPANWDWIMADN